MHEIEVAFCQHENYTIIIPLGGKFDDHVDDPVNDLNYRYAMLFEFFLNGGVCPKWKFQRDTNNWATHDPYKMLRFVGRLGLKHDRKGQ